MSWLSMWFRKDSSQVFITLIIKALKLFMDRAVEGTWVVVQEEVMKAEAMADKTGQEKAMIVFSKVTERLGSTQVRTMYLKFLIEAAVIVMREAKS